MRRRHWNDNTRRGNIVHLPRNWHSGIILRHSRIVLHHPSVNVRRSCTETPDPPLISRETSRTHLKQVPFLQEKIDGKQTRLQRAVRTGPNWYETSSRKPSLQINWNAWVFEVLGVFFLATDEQRSRARTISWRHAHKRLVCYRCRFPVFNRTACVQRAGPRHVISPSSPAYCSIPLQVQR